MEMHTNRVLPLVQHCTIPGEILFQTATVANSVSECEVITKSNPLTL